MLLTSNFKPAMNDQIDWIAQLQTPNGAIRNSLGYAQSSPNRYKITPYYANMAAIAMTKDKSKLKNVKKYMEWYFSHLNWPDKQKINNKKLYGTIDDYYITPDGVESSLKSYDSADSYAATFIMLARAYYEASNDKEFLVSHKDKISMICSVMVNVMDSDSLTWAKPDYKVKYLMDNCEVYKGLKDAEFLFSNVFGDSHNAAYYKTHANNVRTAILNILGNGDEFYYAKGFQKTNWTKWYPDATSQLFPVLFDVISPEDKRAKHLYAKFNQSHDWQNLNASNDFPWVLTGYVSMKMGDRESANNYCQNLMAKYVKEHGINGWYSLEAAWFVLMTDKMN